MKGSEHPSALDTCLVPKKEAVGVLRPQPRTLALGAMI